MTARKIALLSVSDKTGLVSFARGLVEKGFTLLSTGGTLRHLQKSGLPAVAVDDVTGFPEILDGRVKTLHPKVHGGILARRDDETHRAQLARHDIGFIDLVCVNLYPFEQTVAKPDVSWQEAIENIDIGGPAMLRAAAKNHEHVVVVCDPADYDKVLAAMDAGVQGQGEHDQARDGSKDNPVAEVGLALRRTLAQKAFRHTALYDLAIEKWFAERLFAEKTPEEDRAAKAGQELLPEVVTLSLRKVHDLRYGENPHQQAAFYKVAGPSVLPTVAGAEQLGGKQLSFNNINDADAALRLVLEFGPPAAVAVKHTNPCGVGIGPDVATAFERAFRADDVSIFGGIVALNRRVDEATAKLLAGIFLEVIVAPDYDESALDILRRKQDLRLLRTGVWPGTDENVVSVPRPLSVDEIYGVDAGGAAANAVHPFDYKRVAGGLLIQSPDPFGLDRDDWRVVTTTPVRAEWWRQLELAWLVCKHVKSNAIVLVKDDMTVGIGGGQTNRIDAARHAIERAAGVKGNPDGATGSVLASDAFFPFPDVVEAAAQAGVVAIVQPGGSVRDSASIEAANRAGIAMVFTGKRHFKH